MRYKLQRTNGMRNPLEIIALSMGKIVHGISFPFASRTMMFFINNSVNNRITKVHVGMCHIYFGP